MLTLWSGESYVEAVEVILGGLDGLCFMRRATVYGIFWRGG